MMQDTSQHSPDSDTEDNPDSNTDNPPNPTQSEPHTNTPPQHRTPRLNYKQRLFAEQFVIDKDHKQAAIRAGYHPDNANITGKNLLDNPLIAALIENLQSRDARDAAVEAADVIRQLGREVGADIADIYDLKGNLKPVYQWPLVWRKGLITEIKTTKHRNKAQVVVGIKQSDRLARLELLGKHFRLFADKQEIDVFNTRDQSALDRARKTFTGDELLSVATLIHRDGLSENEAVERVERERSVLPDSDSDPAINH